MGREIEHKFLVADDGWRAHAGAGTPLVQGYLCADAGRSVRVRRAAEQAWLTIKGPTRGSVRAEFEYAIPVADVPELLALCPRPPLEKQRHVVEHAGLRWEVDVFAGANAGLVVAEVELEREGQPFERPPWLGAEVTDDPRYLNASLSERPWSEWGAG